MLSYFEFRADSQLQPMLLTEGCIMSWVQEYRELCRSLIVA